MIPVVLTVVGEGGGWYAGQHVGHMLAELLLWDQPQGGGMVGRVNQGQVTHASYAQQNYYICEIFAK